MSLAEYFPIFIFIIFSLSVASILVFLPKILNKRKIDKETISTYECGFEPFGELEGNFNISFYLVAILFIIFDIEIALLIPWSISLKKIGLLGFCSMMLFLFILTVGFIYELRKKALDW